MADSRKRRIAKILDSTEPAQGASHKVSINGSNNIYVGGNLTIGSKPKGKAAQQKGWRDEAMIAIRARALELKLTEDQVNALASSLLKKFVPSLDSLNAAELGRVFDSMHNLRRPALD